MLTLPSSVRVYLALDPVSMHLSFDRLAGLVRGLGLDRHPELQSQYFGNYRRLVYLGQRVDADNAAAAELIAGRLGLEYHFRHTGYGGLEHSLRRFVAREAQI